MKSIAKLAVFFTISFIIISLLVLLVPLLNSSQIERSLPQPPFYENLSSLKPLVIPTLCLSLLLSFSFACIHKDLRGGLTPLCLFILAFAYTTGIEKFLNGKNINFSLEAKSIPLTTGTIAPTPEGPVVLIKEKEIYLSYIESFPKYPLIYNEGQLNLLSPFTKRSAPFFKDSFSSITEQLEIRLNEGFLPFALYLGAFLAFIMSLYGIFILTLWPALNVLLGASCFLGFLFCIPLLKGVSALLAQRLDRLFVDPLLFALPALVIFLFIKALLHKKRKSI